MTTVRRFVQRNSWVYVAVVTLVLWLLMGIQSGSLTLKSLIDNAYTASFLAIIALGQMLVVTTGRGAIDLSLPGMVTLGAYMCMGICNGQNSMIIPALLAVIAAGILVGVCNSVMVIYLRLPSIIAKPIRKWLTNVLAAHCPFICIRIFLYRLCGFKIGKKRLSVCAVILTICAMSC